LGTPSVSSSAEEMRPLEVEQRRSRALSRPCRWKNVEKCYHISMEYIYMVNIRDNGKYPYNDKYHIYHIFTISPYMVIYHI
jgi:hypothetical protein